MERPFFNDIEKLFSEFVEFYGGKVIDKLEENLTNRANADYLFNKPSTIAELKTFQKDLFSGADDLPKIESLFKKWLAEKTITDKQFREYAFQGKPLPSKCNSDIIEIASRTIERAIKKGNKQIQESKNTLNKAFANGILFLINDGNYFFSNEGFISIICNLIGRKFVKSSFDVIIYITINQVTTKPGSELDYSLWHPIYTKVDKDGETIVTDEFHEFINDLGARFQTEFMTMKTGIEITEHTQIEDLEEGIKEINKHTFIPKEIIYKK